MSDLETLEATWLLAARVAKGEILKMNGFKREYASWRELISSEMAKHAESWETVVSCTLSEDQLDVRFVCNHGPNGIPFVLWTQDRVYFPMAAEGYEWVESAPRNPDGKPMQHICGG